MAKVTERRLETVLGFVRHILTFGGGFLVANGTLGQSDMESAVGAIVTLIGIIWSALHKKKVHPDLPV